MRERETVVEREREGIRYRITNDLLVQVPKVIMLPREAKIII